jgi:UPF0271 protein
MLVPRDTEGAVIDDLRVAAERAGKIAAHRTIETVDGAQINVPADSLCVHGDSPNAVAIVKAARNKLESMGFTIAPFAR